jgi:predicted SAM-dependent methyltransferase
MRVSSTLSLTLLKLLSHAHGGLGRIIKRLRHSAESKAYSPAPLDAQEILSRSPLLIDMGGQKNRNDLGGKWIIADIHQESDIVVDLNKQGLPLPSNSVDYLYTSHTLEHILPEKQPLVFSELFRILKPGGVVRIVVPDISRAVQAYVNKDSSFLRSPDNPSKLKSLPDINICYLSCWFFTYPEEGNSFLGGHVMAFDDELLTYYLRQAGFSEIAKKSYSNCLHAFQGKDLERYKDCSLYYEAVKHGLS